MYAATANGTAAERSRAHPQITASRPNVATNSLNICAGPWRAWREAKKSRQLEHDVRRGDAGERADDLHGHVRRARRATAGRPGRHRRA